MSNLFIDCKTGKRERVPLTPEEEAEQQERVTKGAEEAIKEEEKKKNKKDALDRLRKDPKMADVLAVLGLDEPEPSATARTKKAP